MQVNIALNEPATMNEALVHPDKAKWMNAMEKEIEALHANDMWDLVELCEGRKAVGSKWVFKLKLNADEVMERRKARLVAQGFSQKHGLDYDETFSPVVYCRDLAWKRRKQCVSTLVDTGIKLVKVTEDSSSVD